MNRWLPLLNFIKLILLKINLFVFGYILKMKTFRLLVNNKHIVRSESGSSVWYLKILTVHFYSWNSAITEWLRLWQRLDNRKNKTTLTKQDMKHGGNGHACSTTVPVLLITIKFQNLNDNNKTMSSPSSIHLHSTTFTQL